MRVAAQRFKASETLLGIETLLPIPYRRRSNRFKASETLLGIETFCLAKFPPFCEGFKASETLLGIETRRGMRDAYLRSFDSKPLKPF